MPNIYRNMFVCLHQNLFLFNCISTSDNVNCVLLVTLNVKLVYMINLSFKGLLHSKKIEYINSKLPAVR